MLRNEQAQQDEAGRYVAPLRVEVRFTIDDLATALAIAHGAPPTRNDTGGWTGRVGLRTAHAAMVELARRRMSGEATHYEATIPEPVLYGWKRYIVERFAIFPPEALSG